MSDELDRYYDALLIVRFQAGDDTVLEELIARYETVVRSGIGHWLGSNSPAADDLSQEVWMSVLKGLTRLEQPSLFRAWLKRIIRVQVALYLRRRDRRSVPLDLVSDPEDRQPYVPEEPMCLRTLEAAICDLGEPYTSMLRLRFWESYSYQQIAEAMNVPLGTVRSRLHWARTRLAGMLRKEENPNG
jgi:RNA polymerase sigma-70 factor (ECF subfamily)